MVIRRRFGQHFLEPAWVNRLVDVIAPAPEDTFLEIGSGRGALTLALARAGPTILAIEIDRDLARALAETAPPNVQVMAADILACDLGSLVETWRRGEPGSSGGAADHAARRLRVAGNLPYAICSPVIRRLLELHRAIGAWTDATLLVQREVAGRLAARAGSRDYGVLGVLVQQHADVQQILTVPPGAFRPVPRVTSAVVRLEFRPPRVDVKDEECLERLVKSVFQQRRKTLANALKPLAARYELSPAELLAAAHLDPRRRPETLDLGEFGQLADVLADQGEGRASHRVRRGSRPARRDE